MFLKLAEGVYELQGWKPPARKPQSAASLARAKAAAMARAESTGVSLQAGGEAVRPDTGTDIEGEPGR